MFLFFSLRTAAEVHHQDTAEDHQGGKHLLPTEGIHAEADADGGGNDGLHVGVHAYQRRADTFLPHGDEEVSDEGSADDEVSQFGKEGAREGGIVDGDNLMSGKGKRHEGGKKEYPLHERDHRIAGYEGFEEAQVERETETVCYDEQDTRKTRLTRSIGNTDTVEYQEDDAYKTDCHSSSLAQSDRFLQSECGNEHRQDGRNGAHDGAIHRCDVGDGNKEGYLCEEEAEDGGKENLHKILPFDLLTWGKQRNEPKEQTRTDGAQAKERHGRDEVAARQVLAYDDVDAKDGVGNEARQMAEKFGVHAQFIRHKDKRT